jgi:hypothetical protein
MTGIFISLAAVVLLIFVIGFFAMRFLRADDAAAGDFDDLPDDRSMPRENDDQDFRDGRPARGRSRGAHPGGPRLTGDGPRLAADPQRRPGGRPGREPRDGYAAAGQSRGGRGSRDGDPGFPDTGGFDSFDSRPFDRPAVSGRGGTSRDADRPAEPRRPAAAAGRGGRPKGHPGEPDWDAMSDVDYWTELAADKSLTSTAQPASPARPERPADGSRSDRAARDAAAAREDATALLPARRRSAGRGLAESGPMPAVAGRGGPDPLRPDPLRADPLRGGRGPVPGQPARGGRPGDGSMPGRRSRDQRLPADEGVAALAALATGPSQPAPLNDDPLTSPSFPAIRGDDSRSYRAVRPEPGRPESGRAANGYPAGGPYPPAAADPLAGYGQPGGNGRPSGPHPSGAHSGGSRSSGGHASGSRPGSRSSGGHANGLLSGADPNGMPVNGQPGGLLSGGDPGLLPGSRQNGHSGGLLSGGDQGDWAGRYGPPADAGSGTGPNSYRPAPPAPRALPAPPPAAAAAPAAAGYRDYADPAASGNPYGSYVTPAADSFPAAGASRDSEPRYEAPYGASYLPGQETQQYAQPAGRHTAAPALHAAPVPGAPALPAGSGSMHAAPVADPAQGYGNGAYYGGAPAGGYSNGNGNGYGDGHSSGYNGHAALPEARGQQAAGPGYSSGGHARPEYPANGYGAQPYDPAAYPPPDPAAAPAPQDQRGYGTPDSGGYGSEAYGGYPGY